MLPVHGIRASVIGKVIRLFLLAALVISLFASLPVGSVFARPLMALQYQPAAELTVSGNNLGFGAPMALSGNTLVIGAPTNGKGAVYVFDRDPATGVWASTPVTLSLPPNLANNAQFGVAVAIENDTLVVGANMDSLTGVNNDTGAVYIYKRGVSGWSLVQGGTSFYTSERGDRFGESLAISGNTIAVGAPYFDSSKSVKNSGTVYLFRWDAGQGKWVFVKYLQDPTSVQKKFRNDMFGASLAVEGDTLVVGASRANGTCAGECGAVSVYSRNSGGAENWGQVDFLQSTPVVAGSFFGQAVSISGGRIVVGAPFLNSADKAGKAYVFEPTASGRWGQATVLSSLASSLGDQFGGAVGIDGDLLVVGAKNSDLPGLLNSGAVFVFNRVQTGPNTWVWNPKNIQPALTSPASGDKLGSAVMVNGQLIIAGAPGRNSGQGAAYVFNLVDIVGPVTNHLPELDLDQVSNGTGYLATFNEPTYPDTSFLAVPIVSSTSLTVTDVDAGATLTKAEVTITNPLDPGKELLLATDSATVHATYDGLGKLTLTPVSGSTASLSDFQAVLQTVVYKNTSWKPDTSYRYINFVVNDGTSDSNVAVSTVVIVPAKERPVITLFIDGQAPYRINQAYTVHVSIARPGVVGEEAGAPSGDVMITVGAGEAAQSCAATLTTLSVDGTARTGTCLITMKTVGSMTAAAAYNGDSEFSAWNVSTSFMFDYHKTYLPSLLQRRP